MTPEILRIQTPEEMHAFGEGIAAQLGAGDVVLLSGDLGAGKTTFTRGLGEGLGIRGPVTSPTFVLARTHPSLVGGPALVHVDAYRLGSALELDDLDIDFAGSVVVVEWGAGMIEALTDSYLSIEIDRPHGAGEAVDAPDAVGAPSVSAGEPGEAEESEEPDESEPIEPRTVRITGVGPRWS